MVKPYQEASSASVDLEATPRPQPYNIGAIAPSASSIASPGGTQRRIRDAVGRVVLDESRQNRLEVSANQIAFYQELEREGKGNILQPEGKGGPLIWAPKRNDKAVEMGLRAKYDDPLSAIIDPNPDRRDSYYVNGAGTNRFGALLSIAKTGRFNEQILGKDELEAVEGALRGELGELQELQTQRTEALAKAVKNDGGKTRPCTLARRLPPELVSDKRQAIRLATAALDGLSGRIASLESAETEPDAVSTSASPEATTSAPSGSPAPEPSPSPAPNQTSAPTQTSAAPALPPQIESRISNLSDPKSPAATETISQFIAGISQATSSAAQNFHENLAAQRLDGLQQAQELHNFYKSQLNPGTHSVEHTVNIAGTPEGFTNVRIDFTDNNGASKSFVYNAHRAAPMGEKTALLAAQQGIKFEKTSLPSGNPHSVKLTFTQPGIYNVNGREIVVGEQPEVVPTPQRTPYQEFRIGKDAKTAYLKLEDQSFKAVDLSSLQPGQSRKVEENLEVRRLANGELRIRCFAAGQLEAGTVLANGTQSPYSYTVKADPNMQSYYELQQEIAEANKKTDNAERFEALHACTAKAKLLANTLDSPYKENLTNSLKEAQTAMWDKALTEDSPEDFLAKLTGYETACDSDDTLYKLPDDVKARLRRDAGLKTKPKAPSNNPFALAS